MFYFDRANGASLELALSPMRRGTAVVFEPHRLGRGGAFARCLAASDIVQYYGSGAYGGERIAPDAALETRTAGSAGLAHWLGPEGRGGRGGAGGMRRLAAIPARQVVDEAGSGDWLTAGLLDSPFWEGQSGRRARAQQRLAARRLDAAGRHRGRRRRGGRAYEGRTEDRRRYNAPLQSQPVGAGGASERHGGAGLREAEDCDLARHMRLPVDSCVVDAARAIGGGNCFILHGDDPLVGILCGASSRGGPGRGAVRMSLQCSNAESREGSGPPRGGRFEVVILPGGEEGGEAAKLACKTRDMLARAREGRGLRMLNVGLGVAIFATMSATSLVAVSPPLGYVFAAGALAPAGIMLVRAVRWLA